MIQRQEMEAKVVCSLHTMELPYGRAPKTIKIEYPYAQDWVMGDPVLRLRNAFTPLRSLV